MGAWVTRPERPKGVKDEVKQARRAQSRLKGRQLEVGPRRGPRLLVYIYGHKCAAYHQTPIPRDSHSNSILLRAGKKEKEGERKRKEDINI